MKPYLNPHLSNRKVTGLIENQTTYTSMNAELNIFETFKTTSGIHLKFPYPVIVAMINGKKRMKLSQTGFFDFLPGETVIVPEQESLQIDFPEASFSNPTQCITLGIDPDLIQKTLLEHNENSRNRHKELHWDLNNYATHIRNNPGIQSVLQRIIYTFSNNSVFKDQLLKIMLQELILRLIDEDLKSKLHLNKLPKASQKNRLEKVIQYIQKHFAEKNLTVNTLAELACVSSSHFHKLFKRSYGISPIDFINQKRIELAKKMLLSQRNHKISTVAYLSGFNNLGYFNRIFKKYTSLTPSEFKKKFNGLR